MQADKVLVIIVTYNAMRWIERCLSSIPSFADIFVVDNCSSDGTQNFIHKNFKNIHFIQSDRNLGFGAANNIGLQYALDNNYDYVYLLNQDAWLFDDALEQLITVQKKHPEYGILSPLQMQAKGVYLDKAFAAIVPTVDYDKDIIPVQRVMAAHWLISRECIKKVGGFSPTFFHYGEDDNFANRLAYHGFKIGIVSKAKGVHDRENRKKTNKSILHQSYTRTLVYLSDFTTNNLFAIYGFVCDCIKYFLRERDFQFLRYALDILRKSSTIKINKKKSAGKCAFLNNHASNFDKLQ